MALAASCSAPERAAPPSAADAATAPVDAGPDGASAFVPDPPAVYVAKIKNLLVALPPTDDEVAAVTADPSQLGSLVDGWMALPEYSVKMQRFFQLAFQQTQVSMNDFADQTYPSSPDPNGTTAPKLLQNATESFARTALALTASGHPLTDVVTTRTFMMTPALMEFYAFLDAWQVDDTGAVTDTFKAANPKLTIRVEAAQGPIPLAETLEPTSANYMTWYDPDVANASASGSDCGQDPITYTAAGNTLQYILLGTLPGRTNPSGGRCGQIGGTSSASQLVSSDFDTWKMVTIRAPESGENTTAFYDLATLRSATELVLRMPRVGFFTPAFFANWQTNTSNQMRVTANQALIVATGAAVDGTDTTTPTSTPGLDTAHAGSADCLFCHQTLDPTRSVLAATYSWNYHRQTASPFATQLGLFAFQGVITPVSNIGDFAATLASHPRFAAAWAQKLCYYADSAPCDPSDPEFQRVVSVFQSRNYSWNALVREIMTSPLTTNAAPTQTALGRGPIVAVSRRDHLCAALNARLGLVDVCGLDAVTGGAAKTSVPQIVAGLPSDGYGRGAVAPVLPNQPTLFYRAGLENICEAVAALVIDEKTPQTAATKQWSSTAPDDAIGDFVATMMGLTSSDPRAAAATQLLHDHFTSAVQSGASADAALKSTFVVACLSPSVIGVGL